MENWKKFFLNNIYVFLFIGLVILFFYPVIFLGKIPIPADTIVGMYHPWRDIVWDGYTSGVPFKNFLITDPVRQQYVWRKLAIEQLEKGHLPLWNPYSFSGTPLLANFQAAVFYPLNFLFFVLPFNLAWGILVMLQPLLAGVFLYAYLRCVKVSRQGSFIGALVYAFSGFSIAWLEWNTIGHVVLWLPLTLLAIEKIIYYFQSSPGRSPYGHLPGVLWSSVFIFSLSSSFFAGHLQVFFYNLSLVIIYTIVRVLFYQKSKLKIILLFIILYSLFIIFTSIQWLPTIRFINLSARDFDQGSWTKAGWFIPWQHLIQFLAPDFFGNPATLNYWGEWNYAEFLGYIGILPLIFALAAMLCCHDKKVWVFTTVAFISLVFALPTPLAKLPYKWQIPLISTSQPTRLLFLTDFSLSVLAALGMDFFLQSLRHTRGDRNGLPWCVKSGKPLMVSIVVLLVGVAITVLWMIVSLDIPWFRITNIENLSVAKRNLLLPTALFIASSVLLVLPRFTKSRWYFASMIYIIVAIMVFDLFRFGWKFTPFTREKWIFPSTQTIKFLQNQSKPFRILTNDRRIFPPNFSTFYQLEDIAGYDPLYLRSYGELVAAWDRGKPDANPASFNRILTPQDYNLRIADLLNVKYVLSLKNEVSPKLKLVFQEGETRVYENKYAYPRAFLVYDYKIAKNRQEAINFLFDENIDLQKTAIFDEDPGIKLEGYDNESEAKIVSYDTQKIALETKSQKLAILVLGDNFYPGWQAFLDGKVESEKTFRVDFTLRGIIVPAGEHKIEFYPSL